MKTNIKPWRKLSTKKILENRYLKVNEDVVVLPTGEKAKYFITNQNKIAVGIVATDEKNRFLLQKEFRYPLKKVVYELPGGLVEKGETPLKAAKREFLEETGYSPKSMKLIGRFYAAPASTNVEYFAYHATNLTFFKKKPDPGEFLEHEWVSKYQLRRMIKNGTLKTQSALATLLLFFQHKI